MKYLKKLVLAAVMILALAGQESPAGAAGLQGLDVENLPEWEMNNVTQGGTLLFSDSPEMVSENGILYQDQVTGSARLFFYHVNAAARAKKVDVMLENKNKEAVRVSVSQYGLGGPGYDWMAVGKKAMTSYLAGSKEYSVNVPPGGMVPLAAEISETAVLPNMLINGIFDFSADHPINVKVMMLPILENSDAFAKTAKTLPADQPHLRGTFSGANRRLSPIFAYDPAQDGAVALTLADNGVDHYLEGIDATDGSRVVDYGNYGVVYHILFSSKKGGKIAYYFVPLGGDYAGAIGIQHPDVYWSPQATPMGRTSFGTDKAKEFTFMGTYDSGAPITFIFSPPGASNLPVEIVVLPQ
ncbi:MAG: hypothetical protein ABFC57_11500 [Veillonellales bacterium]